MNTLLLTGTEKEINLKPRKIIISFVVLFFTVSAIFTASAQQISTLEVQPVKADGNNTKVVRTTDTKTNAKAVSPEIKKAGTPAVGTYSPAEKVSPDAGLPYYNYKGIADLTEAKKAWIIDHPTEYKEMQGKGTPGFKPANVAAKPTIQPAANGSADEIPAVKSQGQSPAAVQSTPVRTSNADRRLPANYDDSKTNSKSK